MNTWTTRLFASTMLALAEAAAQETAERKEPPLAVEVLSYGSEDVKLGKPPILFAGRQARSVAELRKWLKEMADPAVFPDENVVLPGGVAVSRRSLVITCDPDQVFGWVQMVIHAASYHPGRTLAKDRGESPFIRRIELKLRGSKRDAVALDLPMHRSRVVRSAGLDRAIVTLALARAHWGAPVAARRVDVYATALGNSAASAKAIGKGQLLRTEVGRVRFTPRPTLQVMRKRLIEQRSKGKRRSAFVVADYRAPFAVVFEILRAFKPTRLKPVYIEGLRPREANDLLAGDFLHDRRENTNQYPPGSPFIVIHQLGVPRFR